jgi:hypothetical protein
VNSRHAPEPITTDEASRILDVLARTPRSYRLRLVAVLEQALDDEYNGTLEHQAEMSGQGEARTMLEWVIYFRAVGRPRRVKSA